MTSPAGSETPAGVGRRRSAVAVDVEGLSVSYRTSFERARSARRNGSRLFQRRRGVRHVEALHDVSFKLRRGAVLGVIGANGAGKSTLLRAIAGILAPTSGRIEVRGHVSTLLTLGLGFNRRLTGRDNVMLGGLAAGLSRDEISARYEAIVEYAEIQDFMDVPVRAYSSGMYARLAFSVAMHIDPDILLLDEALGAGDAAFKAKSALTMRELCAGAGAIAFVSHSQETIRELATECIWLHKGRLMSRGDPDEVLRDYGTFVRMKEEAAVLYEG